MQANSSIQLGSLIVSIFSLLLAIAALVVSRLSWLQSNRPIVTARIVSHKGGNMGTALNIEVENTGNRPAKNIRLIAAKSIIQSFFAETESTEVIEKYIMKIFSTEGNIPVLANGKTVSNSFGFMSVGSSQSNWKEKSKIEIEIVYEDLDGREYRHKNPLVIAPNEGFAGSFWSKKE